MARIEWAWHCARYNERAYGTFASKEKALEDAKEKLGPGTPVDIGHVIWADPAKFSAMDVDRLAEEMEENAFEGEYGFFWDDDIFFLRTRQEVGSGQGAEEELQQLLSEWARRWFKPMCWRIEVVHKVKT